MTKWDGNVRVGTRGLGDAGRETRGLGVSGTGERGTRGRVHLGLGDVERKDVINKHQVNFGLNLQFTVFAGQKKGIIC